MPSSKPPSTSSTFSYDLADLQQMAEDAVNKAKLLGAEQATVNLSEHIGLSVNVRQSLVDQSEYAHGHQLSISVNIGGQTGSASTSDLMSTSVAKAVEAAVDFARYTSPDPFSGLPEQAMLATEFIDLDLFHPWSLSMQEAIHMATECETTARDVDKRLTNSEGCTLSSHVGQEVLANSFGWIHGKKGSHHSLSCTMIAKNDQGMQCDGWFEESRLPLPQSMIKHVAHESAKRALRRLSPHRIPTGKFPILFDRTVASSLIAELARAVSGGALYRRASFLLDHLNKPVLPDFLSIDEDPFVPRALASKSYDDEGVKVKQRSWIEKGILRGYFLSSYSARKLDMPNTGHAGGAHNLTLINHQSQHDCEHIIKNLSKGLWVTELMGDGVNGITGDYSRGATGFWIENGEVVGPVEEITIAGNLKTMLQSIEAVGSDTLNRGGITCGPILIGQMTVAGS